MSKRSNERTVYVSPNVRNGERVRWSDWRESPGVQTWYDGHPDRIKGSELLSSYTAPGRQLTIIEYATGSDYSGNLVEASNARVLLDKFPWLVRLHGGHGTFGVAFLGKRENQNPELIEILDGLELYPLVDENDHSELEHEKESEAWTSDGRHDWAKALAKHFDEIDEDAEHEIDAETHAQALDDLWYDCTERFRGGESYLNESGESIYFPIDDVIEDIERKRSGLYAPHYSGDRPSIADQLHSLLNLSRTTEEA